MFILILGYIFHRNHDSKVIYYHDISTKYTDMGTPWDLFREHILLARKYGYTIVDNISDAKGQIKVCFDDGWAGVYEYRLDIINMGLQPTIFLAVDLIGKEGYLTLSQIQELQSIGFVFEGHTWSHQDLTQMNDIQLEKEIVSSKIELSEILGHNVSAICYPKGMFSEKIIDISRRAGYSELYTSLYGCYNTCKNDGLVCRMLCQSLDEYCFRFTINGMSNILYKRFLRQHMV